MKKHILVFDPVSCTGCQSCMSGCSMRNAGAISPASARVHIAFNPHTNRWPATYCRQCTRAACAEVCPVEAISLHPSGDYWQVDYDKCIGCLACVEACPLGAMFFDPHQDKVIKCETCQGHPTCARLCPTGALTWGEAADRGIYRKGKMAR